MPAPKGHPPYNVNGEGGRPRKYNQAEIEKFAEELEIWINDPKSIWLNDFCLDKNINPDFMSKWAEENERFRGALEIAKKKQESKIIKGSLVKKFFFPMSKAILKRNHNWDFDSDYDDKKATINIIPQYYEKIEES